MNLRSKRKIPKRKGGEDEGSAFLTVCGAFVFVLGIAFFGVLAITAYFNGQSEKLNKGIASKERDIYKLHREIENLKIRIESRSSKKFIISRIAYYNLNLHPPNPSQIIYLDNKGMRSDSKGTRFEGKMAHNVAMARN